MAKQTWFQTDWKSTGSMFGRPGALTVVRKVVAVFGEMLRDDGPFELVPLSLDGGVRT